MFRSAFDACFATRFMENPENPAGGATGEPAKPSEPAKPKFEWTPEQQAEINRIAAEERRTAEQSAKAKLEQDLTEKKRQEDEAREREEATKRGEFDKVKSDLESKVVTTEERAKTAEGQVKFLREFVDKTLEREIEELPEVLRKFDPGTDADLQARLNWLETAREAAKEIEPTTPTAPGNRPPKRPSNNAPDREDTKKSLRQSRTGRRSF